MPRGDSGTIGPKPHQQWPRGHLDPALPMPASPHTAVEVESRCGIQEDFQLTVLLFPPPSLLKLQTWGSWQSHGAELPHRGSSPGQHCSPLRSSCLRAPRPWEERGERCFCSWKRVWGAPTWTLPVFPTIWNKEVGYSKLWLQWAEQVPALGPVGSEEEKSLQQDLNNNLGEGKGKQFSEPFDNQTLQPLTQGIHPEELLKETWNLPAGRRQGAEQPPAPWRLSPHLHVACRFLEHHLVFKYNKLLWVPSGFIPFRTTRSEPSPPRHAQAFQKAQEPLCSELGLSSQRSSQKFTTTQDSTHKSCTQAQPKAKKLLPAILLQQNEGAQRWP